MPRTNNMSTITILLSLFHAAARAAQCAFGITILLGSLGTFSLRAMEISLAILHIFGAWLAFATNTPGVTCAKVDLLTLLVTLIGATVSSTIPSPFAAVVELGKISAGMSGSGLANLDVGYSVAAVGIPMVLLLLLHRVLSWRRKVGAGDDVEALELEEIGRN